MWETMNDDIEKPAARCAEPPVTKLEFEGDRCVRVHVGDKIRAAP